MITTDNFWRFHEEDISNYLNIFSFQNASIFLISKNLFSLLSVIYDFFDTISFKRNI